MHRTLIWMTILTIAASTTAGADPEPITTGTLVREMVDLNRLAEFPDPAYKTVQFSSYDRRSDRPGGPHWYANADGFGKEPIPNFQAVLQAPGEDSIGEYLVCDVKGPGAIVRGWTAAINGQIRMYLDDAEQPVYDGSADDFFRRLYRTYAEAQEIDPALFDDGFEQRNAVYCPVPFAKRCRVVWTGDVNKVHFYHLQIRQYASGTAVTTFAPADLKTYREDMAETARILKDPENEWQPQSVFPPVRLEENMLTKRSKTLLELEGPGVLEQLSLRAYSGDMEAALRQVVLEIICDGSPWGQVYCPIGDFFGAGPGINPYDSLPMTVRGAGRMTCRFVMPYKESLKIVVHNRTAKTLEVKGTAWVDEYEWNDGTSMHFYARWQIDHGLMASNVRVQDIPFLLAHGRGSYVGSAISLLNPSPVPHGVGSWWGEGDEKIFIDDDRTPSTFGTGSEDYFNYAWGSPDLFDHAYCGQSRNDGPANRGFVSNFRWHVLDDLPFHERIAFYMELFSHENVENFVFARTAYFYGRPGIVDDVVPFTPDDARKLELPPVWWPFPRGGATNAVFHQAEDLIDQSTADIAMSRAPLWSNGSLCIWRPQELGEKLTIPITIPEDGTYIIRITAGLSRWSGVFSATFDGEDVGFGGETGDINLFSRVRDMLRTYSSRPLELTAGEHEITLEAKGPGAERGGGSAIGLDFIWIHRQ